MYFTVRSAIPEFFYDRDPTYNNLKEAISRGYDERFIRFKLDNILFAF